MLKLSVKHNNMPNNITIGNIGEELACLYLLNNKFKIIERNARYPWGEIDIIAMSRGGTLVFVEVKALKMFYGSVKRSEICFTPEENLHSAKLAKVKRTSSLYANSHPELVDDKKGWQIDLLAIEINHQFPEKLDPRELIKCCQVRHYENI